MVLDDPLAGYTPTPGDPLAGYASSSDRLRVYRSTPAETTHDLRVLRSAIAIEEMASRPPPPLIASRSKAPRNEPKKHEPPPVEELADLVRLYRRRRDEIAQDQSTPDDASLQALRVAAHMYVKRYNRTMAEAAAVLRPLTIGAMG
jgi:hypothetical protein